MLFQLLNLGVDVYFAHNITLGDGGIWFDGLALGLSKNVLDLDWVVVAITKIIFIIVQLVETLLARFFRDRLTNPIFLDFSRFGLILYFQELSVPLHVVLECVQVQLGVRVGALVVFLYGFGLFVGHARFFN